MSQLSEHFTTDELKCPCCGICNVDLRLIDALENLRITIKVPISINSGCRCPKHNAEEGGVGHSYHLCTDTIKTQAADIRAGIPLLDLYEAALKIEVFNKGGIGLYPKENRLHVDMRLGGRARWIK